MHTLQVAAFPKQNGSRPRTVVFTQGKDATVVASHGKVCQGSCPAVGDLWDGLACAQLPVACLYHSQTEAERVSGQGMSCGCCRRSSSTLSSLSARRSW